MSTFQITHHSESGDVPPLEHGDRLSLEEFRRRYEAASELKKAELIQGVVYMQAAVRASHGEPHAHLIWWLTTYAVSSPFTRAGDNTTIRLPEDSEPQPDCYLRIEEDAGGQSRLENDYIIGAPELIAEVALSSASYDLHDKFEVYEQNGVREYIVWRVDDAAIDWFVLRDGTYSRLNLSANDHLKSEVFPGLWLDPRALLEDRPADVLQTLNAGLATEEHQSFVAALNDRGRGSK